MAARVALMVAALMLVPAAPHAEEPSADDESLPVIASSWRLVLVAANRVSRGLTTHGGNIKETPLPLMVSSGVIDA